MEIRGNYQYGNDILSISFKEADCYEDDNIKVVSTGCVCYDNAQFIGERYNQNGIEFTNEINDMFVAVIWDKKNRKLILVSDITTSPYTLYYTEKNGTLFFCTSLRHLLIDSGIERKLNLSAAKRFIVNGFIYGKETLVYGVYKLTFGKYVCIESTGCFDKAFEYSLHKYDQETAESIYYQKITDSILAAAKNQTEIHMPLSGGYDSNCILSTIRADSNRHIHAFTIGGKGGNNEIPTAKRIAEIVDNVESHSCLISTDVFQMLPDIVWRLEGAVYESGVFLQYKLAELVRSTNPSDKVLICGESNNEIQNKNYYTNLCEAVKDKIPVSMELLYDDNPFIATNLMVLKKSSIMLNSFGLRGAYPFKEKEVVSCASSLKDLNGSERRIFKREVSQRVHPDVLRKMKSIGGTTGISALLSKEDLKRLHRIANRNEVIKAINKDPTKIISAPSNTSVKKIVRKCLKVLGIRKYRPDEKAVKELFVIIFQKLFISGEYDRYFEDSGIKYKTSDFIQL